MSRGKERGTSGSDVPGCARERKREKGENERDVRIPREKSGRRYGRWSDRDEMNERAYLRAGVRQRESEDEEGGGERERKRGKR